ncbi:TIM21-domain-containing protein [Hysterangium stoloniferum]|nr:TIM21-domain-containing protein [Hysterangium stoloniferum]
MSVQIGSPESVGPFQLGLSRPATEKVKKWSELSKVLRTTARTSNLFVILLGGSLAGVLVYTLATELFAKNSPTVLYNDACERIKASPAILAYLQGPLSFHNNPPLRHRPRHRTRHVNSMLAVDASGQEHLLLNFYVEGKDPTSIPAHFESKPLADRALEWTTSTFTSLSTLTFDDVIEWTRSTASNAWRDSKRAFAYLTGATLPPLPHPLFPKEDLEKPMPPPREPAWSLSGIVARLKGQRHASSGSSTQSSDAKLWSTGEVHVDLVKVDSSVRNPIRIYVERAPGVTENEGVIRWTSSQ